MIGTHGAPWTPEMARNKALEILAAARVKGVDPAADKKAKRAALTVGALCDLYLADAECGRLLTRRGVAKRPSTLVTDRSRIDRHIRPLLGRFPVSTVTQEDVEHFKHAVARGETAQRTRTARKRGLSNVRGGKGAASRTLGLLGAIFAYAERRRMVRENPVRGVIRYADGQRQRRLSDAEYAALGCGLAATSPAAKRETDGRSRQAVWPAAAAATRFLALTGWRRGEALALRWGMVDLSRRIARLPDTKTGESLRPLAAVVCDVLRGLGPGPAGALVFPPSRGETTMTGFASVFRRIAKAGGLPSEVTPHVLRHSFMSLGNDLGFTEATIGMICGHKGSGSMTRSYIHPGDAVFDAVDRIARTTLQKLAGEEQAGAPQSPLATDTRGPEGAATHSMSGLAAARAR